MSDFGTVDHYVAAVKAAIVSKSPSQPITDITHDIRPFDISHAANVLRDVYNDFPKKTVHIVAVDAMKEKSQALAIEVDGHFFVGFDSGLFSLFSDKKPDQIISLQNGQSTFPAKDVLAKTALEIANGKSLNELGQSMDAIHELYGRQLKVTKREIAGNVISVDHYGNLITNIRRSEFDKIIEINGSGVRYQIKFGRDVFEDFHQYFSDVESGDCYLLFNSSGFLQIGINKGNASELLGLSIDSPVLIEFLS